MTGDTLDPRRRRPDGHRRRQRDATRRRMLDAARSLFLERGYAATTIAAIAESAGVAIPTIYWAFGSKRAIADEIHETWRVGARQHARLDDVLAIREPGARLDAFGSYAARLWSVGSAALLILDDATRADPPPSRDRAVGLPDPSGELRAVVAPLAPRLRRGLTLDAAHDVLVALSLPEVYRALRARGWSDDRYAAWLGRALREQLLERWSPIPG